ncbi:hypothetical protein SAMN05216548_1088 [Faunimonas pinastri]|uniref:Uncharacterized protein n=1 Tax=Faunimonas pinastri TaxID=1855383 RepID=A0A1H9J4Z2_9HYPH|nr:hypothetical protein [Faunimonas pinastri]SEQ81837.1 hypothetical protein SAMN05216548_1088 [Faunimonas pinastri]
MTDIVQDSVKIAVEKARNSGSVLRTGIEAKKIAALPGAELAPKEIVVALVRAAAASGVAIQFTPLE